MQVNSPDYYPSSVFNSLNLFISFLSVLLNQFLQSNNKTNYILVGYRKYFACWHKLFEFLFESVFAIRKNNANIIFISNITPITVVFDKKIKCSLYNSSVAFHLNLWFKLNSFLWLLEFSTGSHKRREQRLTKKTIKFKGRCNQPFWLRGHLKLFLENYYFLENLEMTQLAGGGRIMLIYVIASHCVQNLICESSLRIKCLLI